MKVTVVFGGQFGSEGKGLMAAYLAKTRKFDLATTDAGPNAGHTAIVGDREIMTRHLPMAGLLTHGCTMWLNGGSIIHPQTLIDEINEMEEKKGLSVRNRLVIHPHAAVIEDCDLEEEKLASGPMHKISSTQKGVGAAARRKMGRGARTAKDIPELVRYCGYVHPTQYHNVCVEVAQGYSLSINSGFYPYTTFRCCSPAQGLMNASIPTTMPHEIIGIIRVNPIRVGSLPGASSGDCFKDQKETTWEALGQPVQYTSVTKRVRRVFTYSEIQIEKMIRETAPTTILINFAQTADPDRLGSMTRHIFETYATYNMPQPVVIYGYGPRAEDISMEIKE